MLSIGTVDVHCEERFSQILRIAAWVRWYCWSKLAQLLQRGRYFSNKSEPPEHFEFSRCCFSHGCLFQEDGFNFRFNPFQRHALCKRPVLDLRIGHLSSNDMQGCLFQFVPGTLWTTLECPPGLEILETKLQIHPFLVSQKLKPKIMALWNSHQFTRFYMILSSFESFPMIPFSKSDGYPPGPQRPHPIVRIAHWGSHCDRKPRRLSTRPLPMDTSVALGAWSLTLTPFKTPMDQEIHGKSWDMNHFWKGILWYDSYDGDIFFDSIKDHQRLWFPVKMFS